MAAGQGKRMASRLPKVLHPLAGRPLLSHVLTTARSIAPQTVAVVVGKDSAAVREFFSASLPNLLFVEQSPPRGTGDAVRVALSALSAPAEITLVMNGDCPLIASSSVRELCEAAKQGALAWLTTKTSSPQGLGRIVRDAKGKVLAIVEERDANDAQKSIDEINVGVLAAPTALLKRWVEQLTCNNAQGEYYLTDVLAMAVRENVPVETVQTDEISARGINDRAQLADVERIVQRRQAQALMLQGVTLADPARFDLRGALRCGRDVRIDIGCVFEGEVVLGDEVEIGAHCVLRNVTLAEGVKVAPFSHLDGATVGEQALIGPYARLRPGAKIAERAHVGNFVEIKASTLGAGSKANHLSYLGDAEIGANVNIGAGTITCNYDGVNKHKTTIKDGAFIGSNTALVAPMTVGAGAVVGAGSTLSEDIEAQSLTFTRTRPIVKKNWPRPDSKVPDSKASTKKKD
ncbi:MAG: bifunctional UDP-N-acetylglucosamine diphosphorylase/glucosamine-1-phosphate N-acetyltransferase GlmU [Burkholderiales bacterium]|nr:bifunctional UDP-N-acetylglucosamine diphosphorylase/glucosamine-1-phosphate N-acetyltransferase GlmU [Burkholderiales bacterium]